jgi:hypothetical protein
MARNEDEEDIENNISIILKSVRILHWYDSRCHAKY